MIEQRHLPQIIEGENNALLQERTSPMEKPSFEAIPQIITSIEQTASHSLPRTELIHTGNLKSPRESGIPFYTAAKVLEHYGNEKALPPVAQARALVSSEARERVANLPQDSFQDSVKKLTLNDPYEALTISRPWKGPVLGTYSNMFTHLPDTLSDGRKAHLARQGEKIQANNETSVTERTAGEDVYSETLWRELFSAGGIDTLGEKTLQGDTQMNTSDYEHFLHTSISELTNAGKTGSVSVERVEAVASQRVQEDIGNNPTGMLKDKSLSKFYQELTGEPLWDYRVTDHVADFFMLYLQNKSLAKRFGRDHESMESMFSAFVTWVNPQGKGNYRLDNLGAMQTPQKSAEQFIKSTDGEKNIYKSADEVLEDICGELGIDANDHETQYDFLAHEEAELKGWLGATKHVDHRSPGQELFKQALAIKLFYSKERLKIGKERQGWTTENSPENEGILGEIAGYFKDNPAEWTFRKYSTLYESWKPHHIETPKPHGLIEDTTEESDLDKYKRTRSNKELYQIGVKQLIEHGSIPGTDATLHHVLTTELFPVHQLFASFGLSPEHARSILDQIKTQMPGISDLEKTREASGYIRSLIDIDSFKLRYEAQREIDIQLSDRIMNRIIEHASEKEVTQQLTQPILVVTCGDSRNEAGRVSLENQSEDVATLGAAGHFGIPYDAVSFTHKVSPEAQRFLESALRKVQLEDGSTEEYSVGEIMNNFGAESIKEAREIWESFKHLCENPLFLQSYSNTYPAAMTGLNAAALSNFILGPYVEYVSPGMHKKIEKWMKKNTEGEAEYTIDLQKVDSEKYGHIQERYNALLHAAKETGSPDDWKEAITFGYDSQKQIGADYVQGMLSMIGLDVTKWATDSDDAKVLALEGHTSTTHSNNLDGMAYECGACGGHSGEGNATLMASFINDVDVRNNLRSRGIDLKNISAVGGVFDTTTADTTWNIQSEILADEAVQPLLTKLQSFSKQADDATLLKHETLLNGEFTFNPVDRLQNATRWKNLTEDEKKVRAVRGRANFRSKAASSVQPEGGHVWTGAVVYGRRELLRGIATDSETTTFHVNSATEILPPASAIDVFAGVYEGIRGEYYGGHLNKEDAPYKAQQTWAFTGDDIWALQSAGDRDVFGGLSRQLFDTRETPATRPNYVFVADLETVNERLSETTQLKQILDLDYGIATVYDPEQKQVFRYISSSQKKVMYGVDEDSSWEPVEYLNRKFSRIQPRQEIAVFEQANYIRIPGSKN